MKALMFALIPWTSGILLFWAPALKADAQAEPPSLARFLPGDTDGWKQSGDELYTGDKIFEYIDGAGEVYRAYNYRSLLARRYRNPGRPDILVDFFDMGTAADAFGVFTHGLEGERLDIGQDAVSMEGLLSFWKDRYFVSLYAESETPDVRRALPGLGRKIAGAIPGEGKRPGILALIPEEFNVRGARYFHSHLILNYHHFVSSENVLLLDAATEAVLASSPGEGRKTRLLIIRYPSVSSARQAMESFAKGYLRAAAGPGPVEVKEGHWSSVLTSGAYLAAVLGAPSRDEALRFLAEAGGRLGEASSGRSAGGSKMKSREVR
jgi:hypothetical protein